MTDEARRLLENDECDWCGDYRRDHHDGGCSLCGRFPWERGAYRCDGFVEKGDADERGERLMRDFGLEARP